jgi:hypothetical protein
MSTSPSEEETPPVQSRHPKSTTKQAELDDTNDWIASNTLIASACPISAVTKLIATETSLGKTILAKYDTTKLQGLYATMRTLERIHIVEDLRTDVRLRQERAQKWREVLAMVTVEQGVGEGRAAEDWELLKTACKEALDNTEQLQARLTWCEQNFEAGRLTPGVVAERRVWDEGAEIEARGGDQ